MTCDSDPIRSDYAESELLRVKHEKADVDSRLQGAEVDLESYTG